MLQRMGHSIRSKQKLTLERSDGVAGFQFGGAAKCRVQTACRRTAPVNCERTQAPEALQPERPQPGRVSEPGLTSDCPRTWQVSEGGNPGRAVLVACVLMLATQLRRPLERHRSNALDKRGTPWTMGTVGMNTHKQRRRGVLSWTPGARAASVAFIKWYRGGDQCVGAGHWLQHQRNH